MMTTVARDIPDSVLDEAFHWAVVLKSGTVDRNQHIEFERWLQAPLNRTAWQRIEIIDQEFVAVRGTGSHSLQTLDRTVAQRRNRKLKAVAGSLLMLPLALFFLLPPQKAQYITSRNELKTITLVGGARIYLDGDTSLDLAHSGNTPLLQLHHGRIMVDSSNAKPADKPQVAAGHGRFTPVGTRFVVAIDNDEETDLAVLLGRVRADADNGKSAEANAGQRLRVTARGIASQSDDGLLPGSWSSGVIEADNARLDDVVVALGRYRHGWLKCDPAVASLRVTGVFHANDVDGALHALTQSLPVQIERRSDWWLTVQAKAR